MHNIGESTIIKWITEATKVASRVLKDKVRLKELLSKATSMITSMPDTNEAKTLIRMIRCSVSGKYAGLPRTGLLLIVGAVVYLVAPLDILPDPILIDDAAVIAWVAGRVKADMERFRAWEESAASVLVDSDPEELVSQEEQTAQEASVMDQHLIASVFLTEPVLRQLALQAIPPKIRFMMRDVTVHIDSGQEIHVELALVPTGAIKYSITIPHGNVDIRQNELELGLRNTTAGLVGSKVASTLKQLLDRNLKTSRISEYVTNSGEAYTVAWSQLREKVGSLFPAVVAVADLVSLSIEQEEGRIHLKLRTTLDQVAAASNMARGQ